MRPAFEKGDSSAPLGFGMTRLEDYEDEDLRITRKNSCDPRFN